RPAAQTAEEQRRTAFARTEGSIVVASDLRGTRASLLQEENRVERVPWAERVGVEHHPLASRHFERVEGIGGASCIAAADVNVIREVAGVSAQCDLVIHFELERLRGIAGVVRGPSAQALRFVTWWRLEEGHRRNSRSDAAEREGHVDSDESLRKERAIGVVAEH